MASLPVETYCPLCGTSNSWEKKLDLSKLYPKEGYSIVECTHCHIKKTIPFPEDIHALYQSDAWTRSQDSFFHILKRILLRQEIHRIHQYTGSRKFLDLGTGFGDFSENAYRMGCSVVSADAAPRRPHYIKDLPEISYIHFDYKNYDIEQPTLVNNRVIILRHVLEHIANPSVFLNHLKSYKPSHFYIVVPNYSRLEAKIFKKYDILWGMPQHLWHYDSRSLRGLLKKNGLSIIASGFDTIPVAVPSILRFLQEKRWPQTTKNFFSNKFVFYGLTALLTPFFRNNIIWAIAKTN